MAETDERTQNVIHLIMPIKKRSQTTKVTTVILHINPTFCEDLTLRGRADTSLHSHSRSRWQSVSGPGGLRPLTLF